MKQFYILLVALFLATSAMAQWVPQNSGTMNNLNSIYFTDANSGCAVGDSGIILKTTDGGAKWTAKSSGTIQNLRSVCFTGAGAGYAVGNSGVILKTMDEGENWSPQISGTGRNLFSLHFPVTNTGYAVGQDGTILKTQDAGITWIDLSIDTTYSLTSVFFTDESTGFIAGQKPFGWGSCGIILKTLNGGIDWTLSNEMCSQFGAGFTQVFFTGSNIGYAIGSIYMDGSSPVLIKTLNGGTDWISPGCSIWPYAICFPNADTGYIVGEDWGIVIGDYDVQKTTNGGTDWTLQTSGTPVGLNSVYFTDAETGYIVGNYGTIMKTTNGGLVGLNEIVSVSKFPKLYPTPAKDKITIESSVYTGDTHLSILNVKSQEIMEILITDLKTQVDVSNLPAGVYFVKLKNMNTVEVRKIIKE